MPAVTYAVTLARTRRFVTPFGVVSLHHVQPSFFFGFEDGAHPGARLATPEKALVDFLYLTPARSRLFRALPELECRRGSECPRPASWSGGSVRSRRRTLVARRLEALLDARAVR